MIIEALRARDPEGAAEMIDRHFADVRARIDRLPAAAPAERPPGGCPGSSLRQPLRGSW
jgi:DNA-binding GntR family transcriptional regulator